MKIWVNPGFSLSALFLILTNCGEDGNSLDDSPSTLGKEWEGEEAAFTQEFEMRNAGGKPLLYFKEKNEPFTGNLLRRQTDGGLSVEHYSLGLRHGLQIKRSSSGARVEASYENGLRHGDVVMYDRHGSEKSRIHYVQGTLAKLFPKQEANLTSLE